MYIAPRNYKNAVFLKFITFLKYSVNLMLRKYTSTFLGASLLLTITGIISKGLGFVREMLYANNFGVSHTFDVFLVSIALPTVINASFIYICQNYFIPQYNRQKNSAGFNEKELFTRNIFFFLTLGLIVYLLMLLFNDAIIDFYLSGTASGIKTLASDLFVIFIITIPLNAVFAISSAFLQAKYDFLSTALSYLIVNLTIIICMIFFTGLYGIYIIPIAFVAGYLIQFFYVMWIVKKNIGWNLRIFQVKNIILSFNVPLLLTIAAEVLSLSVILVDRYFMDKVDVGGISSLNYAQNLFALPISIIAIAVSTAVLPKMSQIYSDNDFNKLRTSLIKIVKINSIIFAIITLVFISSGDGIIRIVYERGEFGTKDTSLTNQLLFIFAFGLIFYSTYSVLNKILYGCHLVKELLYLTILSLAVKVLLNAVLVDTFKQNGLAISTLISYIFMYAAGLIIIDIKLKLKSINEIIKIMFFYILFIIIIYVNYSILQTLFSYRNLVFIIGVLIFEILLYSISLIIIKPEENHLIKHLFISFMPSK